MHTLTLCPPFSIAEGSIKVALKGGAPDRKNSLRALLNKEKGSRTPAGGAFRWAVAATANKQLCLQLQAVALPAATVNGRPGMLGDDVPLHVAASVPMDAELFDGSKGVNGPVPILFSEQPEDLRGYLSTAAAAFTRELGKLHMR